jgi:predicted permease
MAAGESREQAERAARREIGSTAALKDRVRDVGWETRLESVWTDVRYAFRRIRRAPPFSLAVVTTLSLGIGASVALFSAMSAVRFASHRYEDPSRLVTIAHVFPGMANATVGMSPAEYRDYRDRARTLVSTAAYRRVTMDQMTARAADIPSIDALQVTSSLAGALGVAPALGRTFTSDDDAIGAAPVALLSFQTWQREYGGSIAVLGSVIRLDDVPYTIVGVLPAHVDFPVGPIGMDPAPAIWLPLTFTPAQLLDRAASTDIRVVARLAPQTSLEQARVDITRIAAAFQQEHPDVYRGTLRLRPAVERLSAEGAAAMAPALTLMLIATVIVLITACANVSGLLLVRAVGRRQEIAIRMVLGGAQRRVLRQLLTETMILSLASGLGGWLVSVGLGALAAHVAPAIVRQIPEPFSAIAFAVALSVVIGPVCGAGPARRLVRVHAADHVRGAILSFQRRRSGSGQRRFVIVQIATALVLLMASALLIRSFVRVLDRPLGFDPDGLLVARTTFSKERYPESEPRRTVERAIVQTLAKEPGIRAAGVTTHLPIADQRLIGYAIERAGGDQIHWGTNALVSAGYFAAMSIPLVAGRTFSEMDSPSAPLVAVVNETMARTAWPNANPIGERLLWGGRRMTVVGVVGDVHMNAWDPYVLPALYGSIDQIESAATTSASFVLRRDNTPRGSAADVRSAMKTFDPELPGPDVLPMTDIIRRSLDQRRLLVITLSGFAAVTTLLAIIGLHGMLAHIVTLRTRELGVRLALGARPTSLVAMVMRDGLFVVVPGLMGGVLVTVALVRGLGALVFDAGSIDAPACAMAIGLLLALVLLTTFVVALRTTRVDPVIALRAE